MNYTQKMFSPFRHGGKVLRRAIHPNAFLSSPSMQTDAHPCITDPVSSRKDGCTGDVVLHSPTLLTKHTHFTSPFVSIMAPSILLRAGKTSLASALHTNLRPINSQQRPAPAASPPPEFFLFPYSELLCQRLLDFHGRKKNDFLKCSKVFPRFVIKAII